MNVTNSDNQEIRKWVFIGGAPRSGTSLLQAILNEHSECVSPPESHILETFVYASVSKVEKIFRDGNQLINLLNNDRWIPRMGIEPAEIVKQLPVNASTLDLFKLYMLRFASRVKKGILIDGSPINIWFLKKLHADVPGCYILHIVRDPRDVVMSTLNAGYNANFDFPTVQIAKQFMESYMQGPRFAALYGPKYLKIYYEELISSPEKVIRSICDFLDIGFEKSMMEFHNSSKKVSSQEETWKENLSKPFLKDNYGKWKSAMKQDDVIRVEHICKQFFEIESNHYETSSVSDKNKRLAVWLSLNSYYFSEFKKRIGAFVNGQKTAEQLDKMPPYERMRVNGLLKK